ncbi:sulfotransferase [Sulfuricurvum sp.]|uniref:sulfotransferase n=1 Tax=Sulfuricurvum sp. TaxID=2025608 RepID=UPI003BAE29B0
MNKWYRTIEKYGFIRHVYNFLQFLKNTFSEDYEPDNKVFVIGLNKTGTTSTETALRELHYKLGNQIDAELISDYTLQGNYQFLYAYLKTANAFQDQPFSFRGYYKLLHRRYPNAKFILTVRKDSDTWYRSLVNFTKKRFIHAGIPIGEELTIGDIKKLNYRYPDMPFNITKMLWLRDRHILLDRDKFFDEAYCKHYYEQHIKEAKEYFQDSPNFLILNIEDEDSYTNLCGFLNKKPLYEKFPHENKT